MKKSIVFILLMAPLLFISCGDDDEATVSAEVSKTYMLNEIGSSGVSGTAKFTRVNATTTKIDVDVNGTSQGGDHPMHIHFNDAATGGDVAVTLTNVSGDTGSSSTTVTALNDETAITYEELLVFDGYINVHLSSTELATVVAQGNIGSNEQ